MESYCDNRSVGVVLTNDTGEYALLTRGRFPIGIAPPAGHVDGHGSPEQAAVDEVYEELGIALSIEGLKRTVIIGRRVGNVCRRTGGGHHVWDVYEATVAQSAELRPAPDETKGAAWCSRAAVQALSQRTAAYQAGEISAADWAARPGLEEVWVGFLRELGHID